MPGLPPPYPPAAEDPATPPPVPMVPRGPLQSPALPAIARRLRLCSSLSGRFRVPHCGGGAHGLSMETTLPRRGDQNLGRLLADLGRLTPTLYLPRARESLLTMVAASRLPGGWRRREEVLLLTARLLGGRCKRTCGTGADAAPYIQPGHHGDGPGPFPVGPDPSVCPEKPRLESGDWCKRHGMR